MILDTEFLISLRAEEATELETSGVPTIVIEELYVSVGARLRTIGWSTSGTLVSDSEGIA